MGKKKDDRKQDPQMRPEAVALRALREMVEDLGRDVRLLKEAVLAPKRPTAPPYPHNPCPLSIALPVGERVPDGSMRDYAGAWSFVFRLRP